MRSVASKFIAAFLLLLFVEKAELRLFIHDYLHTRTEASAKDQDTSKERFCKQSCDCLDDFFLPLAYTEEFSVTIPTIFISEIPTFYYKSFIYSSPIFSNKLRGPPVC
jgi:hypothetical protein